MPRVPRYTDQGAVQTQALLPSPIVFLCVARRNREMLLRSSGAKLWLADDPSGMRDSVGVNCFFDISPQRTRDYFQRRRGVWPGMKRGADTQLKDQAARIGHRVRHVLRHTTAMDLLQEGIEQSVIALWLGHESIETTQVYLDATLELKQQILDKTTPPNGKPGRYRPDDRLIACLKSL